MRKTIISLAAAAALAAALPSTADARCRGCGVAAGVVGGVAIGALLGSALAGPRHVERETVYVERAPSRVYYEPICHVERHRVWVRHHGWRYRRVEVCD